MQAITDAGGRFRGRGGVVRVWVDRADPRRLDQRTNWVASSTVAVLPAAGTVTQDFEAQACALRLRVLRSDGAPGAGASVLLCGDDGMPTHELGPSGADGWSQVDVEPGAFAVQLLPDRAPIARVVVTAGGRNEAEVRLPDGGR